MEAGGGCGALEKFEVGALAGWSKAAAYSSLRVGSKLCSILLAKSSRVPAKYKAGEAKATKWVIMQPRLD